MFRRCFLTVFRVGSSASGFAPSCLDWQGAFFFGILLHPLHRVFGVFFQVKRGNPNPHCPLRPTLPPNQLFPSDSQCPDFPTSTGLTFLGFLGAAIFFLFDLYLSVKFSHLRASPLATRFPPQRFPPLLTRFLSPPYLHLGQLP